MEVTLKQSLIVTYENPQFSLAVEEGFPQTNIVFTSLTPVLRTGFLPATLAILKEQLPGVLATKCHNDGGWGFEREVEDTEIGHLFEHILIQNISEFRESYLMEDSKITGETQWDWTRDAKGIFNIRICSESPYDQVLTEAIEKSISIVNLILSEVS